MRRSISFLQLLFLWIVPLHAAGPQPLTTLRQIHTLTNEQASQTLPVAFQATVTYYDPGLYGLWVQDDGLALYVETAAATPNLVPGDRVAVRGVTQGSFRPIVVSSDVAVLAHGAPPPPRNVSFADLISGDRDCLRVTVHATVRAADLGWYANRSVIDLQLLMDGGYIDALIPSSDQTATSNLLDDQVEITGVVSGTFDGKKQLTGAALFVNSLSDIRVIQHPTLNPQALPLTLMDRVLRGYRVQDLTQRIRVQGTITYYQPGATLVLQNGQRSILLMTQTQRPLQVGDLATASGFPDNSLGYLTLNHSEISSTDSRAPIAPTSVSLSDLRSGAFAFDLVSTEGELRMAVRETSEDDYVFVSGGHIFSAIYRHPAGTDKNLPPFRNFAALSTVHITGICMPNGADPFNKSKDVDILLRSPDDVTLIAPPPLFGVRNLIVLAGILLLAVIVACVWGWALSRKINRQVAAMARRVEAEAALEKRRSSILEDINGSRPLEEIIEQITQLVSITLGDARCWCELGSSARVGHSDPAPAGWTVRAHQIASRSGSLHGLLYAAVNPLVPEHGDPKEALAIGAWLATVAIETRGLYSDLVHRSEYDLLTDIYNRFSLEKQLGLLVTRAGSGQQPFGLIYIDLDDFKQVNDAHGHQIGDQYLQQSAARMKNQLRPGDLLARMGGDEFAALIPNIHTRTDAIEIAQRLDRCFADPFALQDCVLRGAASVGIAFFPEDGTTSDSLLSAADAAMYVAKNVRRANTPAQTE